MTDSEFMVQCWERAKQETPELWDELITLEYVLTQGFSDSKDEDWERMKEIDKIIYRPL